MGGRAFGTDDRRAMALGATAYARGVDDVLGLMADLPARREPGQSCPSAPADEEAAWLMEYSGELTPYVLPGDRAPPRVRRGAAGWWTDLESHLDHVVGCLAAAVVTGDETVMTEVREWLTLVLTRRGGHAELVDEIWELLAEPLLGHGRSRGSTSPRRRGSSTTSRTLRLTTQNGWTSRATP